MILQFKYTKTSQCIKTTQVCFLIQVLLVLEFLSRTIAGNSDYS
jgi:hypothetical protein